MLLGTCTPYMGLAATMARHGAGYELLQAGRWLVRVVGADRGELAKQIEHSQSTIARSRALIARIDALLETLDPGAGFHKPVHQGDMGTAKARRGKMPKWTKINRRRSKRS